MKGSAVLRYYFVYDVISTIMYQVDVAMDLLNRLHTMPTLPTMDSWLKIYQQIKCLMRATTDARTKRTDHNQVWAEV